VQFLAGEGNNSPATRPELTNQHPIFMYVTCILYIVFISTNNTQYIFLFNNIYIITYNISIYI